MVRREVPWGVDTAQHCCGQRLTPSWWLSEKGHRSSRRLLVTVLQFGGHMGSRLPFGSSGSRWVRTHTCHFRPCELGGVSSLPGVSYPDCKVNMQTRYTLDTHLGCKGAGTKGKVVGGGVTPLCGSEGKRGLFTSSDTSLRGSECGLRSQAV